MHYCKIWHRQWCMCEASLGATPVVMHVQHHLCLSPQEHNIFLHKHERLFLFYLSVSLLKFLIYKHRSGTTEESVSNGKAMSHTERHIATPCPRQRLCLSFALPCMQHSMRSIYTQTGTCRPVPANIKPTNLNTNLRFDPWPLQSACRSWASWTPNCPQITIAASLVPVYSYRIPESCI